MVERSVTIVNQLGLHARAAAQLVRMANSFNCSVRLDRIDGSAAADAKSILSVLLLAARAGTELRIVANGEDESAAVAALSALFLSGFGEVE